MSDEIHSSSWTGPPQPPQPEWERRWLSGGAPSIEQLRVAKDQARQRLEALPPESRRAFRRSGWLASLVLLSPLLLVIAHFFAGAATSGALVADHAGWLSFWGLCLFGLGFFELRKLARSDEPAHDLLLSVALFATVIFSVLYDYAAITSRRGAVAPPPERTFEIVRHRNPYSDYLLHQRADGSTLEGEYVGAPMPYGSTCAEVQRLNGAYGFAWVKVLRRSPLPAHEVIWPIRREDCFSNKPLAPLKR